MRSGTLYTKLQDAGNNVKRGVLTGLLFLAGTLFSISSISQTFYQVTNTSGSAAVGGVSVTVTSAGSVSTVLPCSGGTHYEPTGDETFD